jgi:hypothetical protein
VRMGRTTVRVTGRMIVGAPQRNSTRPSIAIVVRGRSARIDVWKLYGGSLFDVGLQV